MNAIEVAELVESMDRSERMAVVEVFAKFGDRTQPPVEPGALAHLRWLVAEVKRLEALLPESAVRDA